VKVSTIARHRNDYKCEHAVVVGRAFPTGKDGNALTKEIDEDRSSTRAAGKPRTITLITIEDLAKLVRLRPLKQLGLRKLRELLETSRTPEDSSTWIEALRRTTIKKPPYKEIVTTIERLQKKHKKLSRVKYAALLVELSHLTPPIDYDTEEELREVCKAMAQMAPQAMFAGPDAVELDQSAANVIEAIEGAMKELPEDPGSDS
jgi:hypothetical protein